MKSILKNAALIAGVLSAVLWLAEYAGAGPLLRAEPAAEVPPVVSYQGQVTWNGAPYDGVGYFKFAVVDVWGTTSYWSNDDTSLGGGEPADATPLTVTGGLFDVLLGNPFHAHMTLPLDAAVFDGEPRLLRVWFSTDNASFAQLSPDRRIAAVPYALQAEAAADAGMLNGQEGSYYQDATNLNAGTLSTDRYSAYADLGAEGRLNNNHGDDLLTRSQADVRYRLISYSLGLTATAEVGETYDETLLSPTLDSYCFLGSVEFFGINRDQGAACEIFSRDGNYWLSASHADDGDARVECVAFCFAW